MNDVENKVLKDIDEQKNETGRMKKNKSLLWKVRGFLLEIEYWVIAFSFPISIIILLATNDFWKAIVFYFISIIWSLSANIRGVCLHIENYVEWEIKKNI